MKNMSIHVCVFIFLVCFSIPIGCFGNIDFDENNEHVALFVFGDSLFDAGNNNYINTTVDYRANFWPYGESFLDYPTGRFSNGRLIPDFIAEYANLQLIPSYFEALHSPFNSGVNFASIGGGCLDETYCNKVINLKTQLKYFKNVTERLIEDFGRHKSKELVSNAVYLFSIGSNDYINLFETNPAMPKQYVDFVVGNLTTVIKEIYKEGGRHFGIMNVAPIGCVPHMRALNIIQEGVTGECMDELTTNMAKMHNLALSRELQALEKHLKGFKYSNFNFFDQLTKRIQNPSTYGFKETETACCGSGPYRGSMTCGRKNKAKGYELCENVEDYLFFDAYHPTQLADQQFAKLWWQGSPDVVGPHNLKSFFHQLSLPQVL